MGRLERPKRVRIGTHLYTINYITHEAAQERGILGQCFNDELRIDLDESLAPTVLADTWLHECLHAIHYQRGLTDRSSEEAFTAQTAPGITELMLLNPSAWRWWMKNAKPV